MTSSAIGNAARGGRAAYVPRATSSVRVIRLSTSAEILHPGENAEGCRPGRHETFSLLSVSGQKPHETLRYGRPVWPNNWRRSARVVSCFSSNSVT